MNIPSTTSKEAFYILEPGKYYLEAQEVDKQFPFKNTSND